MSNKDKTESDWTSFFNKRYGSGITRSNVEIWYPIVQNFTIPVVRYNNGTVNPPAAATNWEHLHPASEPLRNEDITAYETSHNAYLALDTNPNYKGDGMYYPDYQKHGVLYDYPEWNPGIREDRLKQKKQDYPLEIRRRMYI